MSICQLCNSSDLSLYTEKLRFGNTAKVMRCNNCGIVFLDQNSFKFPADFYESQYHQTYLTHIDSDILDPQKYYEKMKKVSAPWIKKVGDMLTGKERVLDIGCSTGHLITGIQDKASEVYGHELSKKEVDFCKNTLKINVDDKPLKDRFEKESFDIITMIFVFEHIGNPVPFLEEIKSYLKLNGKLIILVPNIFDPLISLYDIKPVREFYFCIEHLFYYSPETLSKMVRKAGLKAKVDRIQEYPITNHLNWIYHGKPRETLSARSNIPPTDFLNENLKPEFENFWKETNRNYQERLLKLGYSDRIWCIAEHKND